MKRNPLPLLLTAVGLTWLVASTLKARRSEFAEREDYLEYLDDYGSVDEDESQARASGMRSRMRTRWQDGVAATRQRAAYARGRMGSAMEEQPLLFGALAVAIGAAIGAALPTSKFENRTVGQARDRALAKAREMGKRQYDNLRSKFSSEDDEVPPSTTHH